MHSISRRALWLTGHALLLQAVLTTAAYAQPARGFTADAAPRLAPLSDEIRNSQNAAPATEFFDGEDGVLVMQSGGLVGGQIFESGEDFEVKVNGGTMLVPGSLVHLRAHSIRDAYNRLESVIAPDGGIPERLHLAMWCIQQKQYELAREQTRRVLTFDSLNQSAQKLLRRIDQLSAPVEEKPAEQQTATHDEIWNRLGEQDPVSVGGLSKESGREFATQIQPLLSNSCAAGGCHGALTTSRFQLTRVRGNGNNQAITESNIQAVLKMVSFDRPMNSPLLRMPVETHGQQGRKVLPGSRGAEQFERIVRWVETIATERLELANSRRGLRGSKPASEPWSDVVQASAIDDSVTEVVPAAAERPSPARAARTRSKASRTTASRPTRRAAPAPADKPPSDPFDPDQFNRLSSGE